MVVRDFSILEPDFLVIVGPMFSGKTSRAIAEAQQYLYARRRIVYLRPRLANRGDDEIVISHGDSVLQGIKPTMLETIASASETILSVGLQHDVVIVDEGHFLGPEVFKALLTLFRAGRDVIFCGCDTDFRGEPFDTVARVMAIPEVQIHKLTARCALCGRHATRSQKLVGGRPAPPTSERFETGGEEKYRALCLRCFAATNGDA